MSSQTKRIPGHDLWWRAIGFFIGLPLLLGVALTAVSLLSDGGRIPSELAAAAQQPGVMRCSEGRIDHGDGSLIDRIFDTGQFRCTAWRMRQHLFDSSTGTTPWPTSPRR